MIDLNEFRKYLSPGDAKDIIEIVDRAIAAESERDELKTKLAEIESQKPAKEKSRTYDPRQCCDVVVIEVPVGFPIYARQIPSQPIANNGEDRQALIYLMDRFEDEFSICENCGRTEPTSITDSAIYLKEYLNEHPQVTPNNSEPVQRITEQDAREIARSLWQYLRGEVTPKIGALLSEDKWFDFRGRTLLAKLNEHRELEVKPKESVVIAWRPKNSLGEPYAWVDGEPLEFDYEETKRKNCTIELAFSDASSNLYAPSFCAKSIDDVIDRVLKYIPPEDGEDHISIEISALKEILSDCYYLKATPNKAEVQTIRDDLHHLLDGLENLLRNSNDTYDKGYIRGMMSKVSLMIIAQPLKGE